MKDGLSKELFDDIILTLETHPNSDVYVILHLKKLFNKEKEYYSIKNLILKILYLLVYKKIGWEAKSDS